MCHLIGGNRGEDGNAISILYEATMNTVLCYCKVRCNTPHINLIKPFFLTTENAYIYIFNIIIEEEEKEHIIYLSLSVNIYI